MEIRVYFEALEQALHFMAPAVAEACEIVGFGSPTIRLVKLSRLSDSSRVARSVLPLLRVKDPDGLITIVADGLERGVASVEFSTAVDTEDHVLQRFDALMAAGHVQVPFIKVYAPRKSGLAHGGRVLDDPRSPYKLLQKRTATPGFELQWPMTDDCRRAITSEAYLSCPAETGDLAELLAPLMALAVSGNDPIGPAVLESPGRDRLPTWARKELLANEGALALPEVAPGGTRLWRDEDGNPCLKFNRWNHAMDPERGMSWYYASAFDQRLRGFLIDKGAATAGEAYSNLASATGLDPDLQGLRKVGGRTVEVSEEVAAARLNRSGLAIFNNCSEFNVLGADGDRDRPLLVARWQGRPSLADAGAGEPAGETVLAPRSQLGEDEVTYAVAHRVLRPAGFRLVAVSYPGAQGDFALLGAAEGRSRSRAYIDIIAFHPDLGLLVVEAKGKWGSAAVEDAAEKAKAWRDDADCAGLLREVVAEVGIDTGGCKIGAAIAFLDEADRERELPAGLDVVFRVASGSVSAPVDRLGAFRHPANLSLPETFRY